MTKYFPLPGKVKRNIDILLDIVYLQLGPGLPDDGGHGPVPDPLTDPLLEDEPDLRPVPGCGMTPHHDLTRSVQLYTQRQQHFTFSPSLPPQSRGEQSGEGGHALPQPRLGGAGGLAE